MVSRLPLWKPRGQVSRWALIGCRCSITRILKVHNREHSRDTVAAVGSLLWWPLWLLMVTGSDDRTEAIELLKGEANGLADIARAKQRP